MSDAKASYDLAYAFGVLMRFNSMLLLRLVGNGALTAEEAKALIHDVADKMPDDNSLRDLTETIRSQFP